MTGTGEVIAIFWAINNTPGLHGLKGTRGMKTPRLSNRLGLGNVIPMKLNHYLCFTPTQAQLPTCGSPRSVVLTLGVMTPFLDGNEALSKSALKLSIPIFFYPLTSHN